MRTYICATRIILSYPIVHYGGMGQSDFWIIGTEGQR